MKISVIVATHRQSQFLGRCLSALAAQTLAPSDFEVIVVDTRMTPASERQVRDTAARAQRNMRYMAPESPISPAAALNLGWQAAGADIVAFTEEDCVPDPAWLANGLAAFTPGTAAIRGRTIIPLPYVPTDYELTVARIERKEFTTANAFCRREALERVGGFDERFTHSSRQDSDLHFSLLESGAKVARTDSPVVTRPIRTARFGVSVREQREYLYEALLYKKHPHLYRARVRRHPPVFYYGIVSSLVLSGTLAATGALPAALASAGVWGVMTSIFCIDRLHNTVHTARHITEMAVTSVLIPPVAVFWRLRGAIRYRVPFV